jgi:hypothetical protein
LEEFTLPEAIDFETTKDVDRILQNLMLASGQKILPEKNFRF